MDVQTSLTCSWLWLYRWDIMRGSPQRVIWMGQRGADPQGRVILSTGKKKWNVCAKSLQLCLTLSDPMGCSLPGSSVHGILQAWILEWVVMPSSRGSSHPRDRIWVSCIVGVFFTVSATKNSKKKQKQVHMIPTHSHNFASQILKHIQITWGSC